MKILRNIWFFVQRTFYIVGVYPSKWQLGNPFKTLELAYLVRESNIKCGEKLFDFGCGKGIQTQVLGRNSGEAIGFDLGDEIIGPHFVF